MTTKSLTRPSTPTLSEAAAHFRTPSGITTTGWPKIEAKGVELGIEFDWWQKALGRACLAKRSDGKYAATVGGIVLSIPRQVGKTYFVGALIILLCICFPGLQVVWSAHHLRTTTKTFKSMQGMVKRKKVRPHLADDRSEGIRTANGEQEIRFRNGSVIMFGARSQGFGRGFDEIDIEVFDEAQILDEKALEDMVAATNQARHEHGALLFYMGTPPRPTDPSEAFTSKRRKAIEGRTEDMVYLECAGDDELPLDDPEQLFRANFSYPERTPHESMLRLRENLVSDDAWRREALGIWDKYDSNRPISPEDWRALKIPDEDVPTGSPDRFALTMSPARVACIAVGIRGKTADYLDLAELDTVEDSRKLVDWLVARAGRRTPVLIDSRDPAASFIADLKARHVKVQTTSVGDSGRACGGLVDAVTEKRIAHCDQPAIRAALSVADTRDVGKAGLWEWALEDQAPETAALRALTLVHYGLSFEPVRSAPKRIR